MTSVDIARDDLALPPRGITTWTGHRVGPSNAARMRIVPIGGDCEFHGPHADRGCPECTALTGEIAGNLRRRALVVVGGQPC
jgi:hypothetical protein